MDLILDIGSGHKGSSFINQLTQKTSNSKVVSLEHYLKQRPTVNSLIMGNGYHMPFKASSFNMAYAGGLIRSPEASRSKMWQLPSPAEQFKQLSYEVKRILEPNGIFIFSVAYFQNLNDIKETLRHEGFNSSKNLEYLLPRNSVSQNNEWDNHFYAIN